MRLPPFAYQLVARWLIVASVTFGLLDLRVGVRRRQVGGQERRRAGQAQMQFAGGADGDVAVVEAEVKDMAQGKATPSVCWPLLNSRCLGW
jgi:hypothetical protein